MAENSMTLHPADDTMLAYIRRQIPEGELRIRIERHSLECSRCWYRLSELEQTTRTLDVIGQMVGDQRYPELSPVRVLASARHGIRKNISGNIDRDILLKQSFAYELKKMKRSSFFAASFASLSLLIVVMGILNILIGNILLGLTISATVGITGIFLYLFLNKVRKAYKQIDELSKLLQEDKVLSRNLSIDNEAYE